MIVLIGLFSTSFESVNAQCIRPDAYGNVVSNNSGLLQGIITCAYSSAEYSTVTGLTLGEDYVFAAQTGTVYGSGTHVYVTITDTSNTVIQHGQSPQTVTNIAVNGVRIHLSDDASCAGTADCHNTTVLLITSCIVPSGLSSTNVTTTSADISWVAPVNVPSSGYDYYYSTSNTAPTGTTTPSGNVASGTTANLIGLNPSTEYYYWVRSNCGTETSSWSSSGTFTTACVAITVPSTETFSTFIPACWEKASGGDTNTGPTNPDAGNWYEDGFGNVGTTGAIKYNFYTSNTNDWFISPQYIIPATGYEIKFDAAATQYNSTSAPTTPWESDDVLEVLASTGTGNWIVLYTFDTNNAPSNTGSINIININAFAGQTVRFAFRMVEGSNDGAADIEFFVDNFQVRQTPSCPEPISLSVSAIATTSAQLAWTEMGSSTTWNIEYGPAGYTQGTGGTLVSGVTTNPYVLNGLTANTQYDYYVQADCGGTSGTSYWTGPFTFTTACVPFGNFTENFDTTPSGGLTNCWYKIVNSTSGFARVSIEDNVAFTEPNSAELYNSDDVNSTLLLITPNLIDLPNGTHRLKFRVSGGTNYAMEVGTMSDPTNETTYNGVEPFQVVDGFNEFIVDFSTVTTTDHYIAFKHLNFGSYQTIKIDNVVWEPVPATVPSCASNIVVTPDPACGNFATSFAWDATLGADGYRITIGTTSGGNDVVDNVDLGNVTAYSHTGNFNTTYYFTLTPYNLVGDAVSCSELSYTTFVTGCYCTSLPTSNDDLGITNVQLGTTAFPTTDVTYFDHTATSVSLPQGVNTNVQISFATGYTYNTYIWIDFNDNLTFDASELVFTGVSTNANPTVLDASFIMPATAALGVHRMRITTADDLPAPDPCYSGSYGVTLDFSVDITLIPSCLPPTSLTVTNITSASADLGWTENGTATVWDIEWGTSGFTPTGTPNIVATTTNPHNLTGLTSNTAYSFYVRSSCGTNGESTWSGPFSFTTNCDATNVPYVMDFETAVVPALPNCTAIQNVGTGNLWTVSNNPGFGFTNKTLQYLYSFSDAANVWFYTQGLNLTAGTTYAIAFDYGSNSTAYVEQLKVAYGTSANATAMTNTIVDLTSISNDTPLNSSTQFTPTTSGVYYFGFNAHSAANQYNLYVDNINVDVFLNSNTFDNSSFVAYPNPVKDVLNLSYSSEISSVKVINLLGQEVISRKVGNTSTQIDMTSLTAGAYIVKLTIGDVTKTIKVIKQ